MRELINHTLIAGKEELAVIQLQNDEVMPKTENLEPIWAIIKTYDEVTLILSEKLAEPYSKKENGWRYLKVKGIFDFGQIGILSSILNPLADGGISILTFSTFNTDYIMIKDNMFERSIEILQENGYTILKEDD